MPHTSVEEQLQLLEGLASFPLGQFLLLNGGPSGYWTDYIFHPETVESPSSMEDFLLKKAPVALATQERFAIFQRESLKRCRAGVTMASVPCGLMSDLLTLDLPNDVDSDLGRFQFLLKLLNRGEGAL